MFSDRQVSVFIKKIKPTKIDMVLLLTHLKASQTFLAFHNQLRVGKLLDPKKDSKRFRTHFVICWQHLALLPLRQIRSVICLSGGREVRGSNPTK